jgi:hypothetical protein
MKMSSGYPILRKLDNGTIVQRKRDQSQPRIQMLPTSYIQREKLSAAKFMSTVERLEEKQRGIQRLPLTEN